MTLAAEGKTILPDGQPTWRVWRYRLSTLLVMIAAVAVGLTWLRNYLDSRPLAWVPYSPAELQRELGAGRTVLLCFTADWDPAPRHLQWLIERTPELRRAIRSRRVTPMLADWSNDSPQVRHALAAIGRNSIPALAIYPAATPERPIVLVDLVTSQQILQALQQAADRAREKEKTTVSGPVQANDAQGR